MSRLWRWPVQGIVGVVLLRWRPGQFGMGCGRLATGRSRFWKAVEGFPPWRTDEVVAARNTARLAPLEHRSAFRSAVAVGGLGSDPGRRRDRAGTRSSDQASATRGWR